MPDNRTEMTTTMYHALKPLFQPANVAVIGASNTQGKQGNTAIRYLQRCGYEGGIFPIIRANRKSKASHATRVSAIPVPRSIAR